MSRIGKKPVPVPAGVTVNLAGSNVAVNLDLDRIPAGIACGLPAKACRNAANRGFRCPSAHQNGDAVTIIGHSVAPSV